MNSHDRYLSVGSGEMTQMQVEVESMSDLRRKFGFSTGDGDTQAAIEPHRIQVTPCQSNKQCPIQHDYINLSKS